MPNPKIRFPASRVPIAVSRSRRLIACDLTALDGSKPAQWPRARELVYFLLNSLENSYRIVIHGAPGCLFPDAEDHVVFTPAPSERLIRTASCPDCKSRRHCPGLPSRLAGMVPHPEPIADLPKEIVIEVGKECNLHCRACFAGTGRAGPSFREIKRIADRAKSLGIKSLRFSGGEPLLRPDIFRLLEYAKESGFYVILNTNATLCDAPTTRKLAPLVDNALISLQGCDPGSDRSLTRGAVPFAVKLGNIARVVDSGIAIVRIGTIMSGLLLRRFRRYADVVVGLGVKNWELYRPMLDREALAANPAFNIRREDAVRLCRSLDRLNRLGFNAKIANAFPFCLLDDEGMRNSVLMGAGADEGHSRLIFDGRGFFKPSYFINQDLGTDIVKAWHHPFLKRLNSLRYLPAACRRCRELKWCLGGSRFWAFQASGGYFRRDPWMPSP
ncbi:MAG TPA: hypothetical protein DEB40_14445 [Elusimicrobia bacterium]|nr:hypothetical protein [Elusimicrobiota bacterium]HBT62933.1 hypothetical protein [Elusimicrobiota bacterium]